MGNRPFSWYEFFFGPPFRLIGFFYRSYQSNRARLTQIMSKAWVSSLFSKAVVITLIVWILVWWYASEEQRNRLTEAVKNNFNEWSTSTQN